MTKDHSPPKPVDQGATANAVDTPWVDAAARLLLAFLPVAILLMPPRIHGAPAKLVAFQTGSVLLLLLLLLHLRKRTRVSLFSSPATLGFLFLGTAALLGITFASQPGVALTGILMPVGLASAFVCCLLFIRNTKQVQYGLLLYFLGTGVVSAYGLIANWEFRAELMQGLLAESDRASKLSTPFFEHSYLATQAVIPVVPAALALVLLLRTWKWKIAFLLLATPAALYTATVHSRGLGLAAVVGLVVALTGSLILIGKSRRWRLSIKSIGIALSILLAIGLGVGAAAHAGMFPEYVMGIGKRFGSFFDPTLLVFNYSRILVWEDALRMASDSLPFGVGAGNFGVEFGNVHMGQRSLPHAHNQFLQSFSELGPLGLVGILLATFAPSIAAFRALKNQIAGSESVAVLLGLFAGYTVFLVAFLIEAPAAFPASGLPFALTAGVLIVIAHQLRPEGSPTLVIAARTPRLVTLALLVFLLIFSLPLAIKNTIADLHASDAIEALSTRPLFALSSARRSVELGPDLPETWRVLALAQRNTGDMEGALDSFASHDRLAPGIPSLQIMRAATLAHHGRMGEAIECLQTVRWRVPDESRLDVNLQLAEVLYLARRFEEARILLLDLISFHYQAKNPIVLRRLAETLLNLKRERGLTEQLLHRYIQVVPEAEASYARSLLDRIDTFYEDEESSVTETSPESDD